MPSPTDSSFSSSLGSSRRAFLRRLFPGDDALFDPAETHVFASDASRRQGTPPLAVVRPGCAEQMVELMAWAHLERVPLYLRARGSNVVGDCVPGPPGIVVSTLKLNRILEVNANDFLAVAEPGVVTADIQAAAESLNLFYPPDPASIQLSTIGGNVATCAGGMRAVKYGVTRDYVLGLEAILPGGEIIRPGGRTHKNVVGLDLARLLTGSEGALAFISKITLKLLPLPEASASLLAGFSSLDDAIKAVSAVFGSGLLPSALELLDAQVLRCIEAIADTPWPADAQAALLIKLDGSGAAVQADMQTLERAAHTASPTLLRVGHGEEEKELWELRRLINPASFQLRPHKFSDDITVPRSAIGPAFSCIQSIAHEHNLPILAFGHVGDGNIHVNIMHDGDKEAGRARTAKEAVTDMTLELRGSLSGEHGVGLTKLPILHRQLSHQEISLMRQIKRVFDPHNILNPGKAY